MSHLLQTYEGNIIDIFNPDPKTITIKDIARGLAFTCRYGGHTPEYYSVAEHSIIVSKNVPAELAGWGLLHDAAEAYMGDIPRPIKKLVPIFMECEDKFLSIVSERFGLDGNKIPLPVKEADNKIIVTEAIKMGMSQKNPKFWDEVLKNKPYEYIKFEYYDPYTAEKMFIKRAKELKLC